MPIDEPGSPRWWLARLHKKLRERQKEIERFDRYYRGDYELKISPRFARNQDLAEMLKASVDNWMAIVVDSVAERLVVEGFRLGDNQTGDRRAWRIWQANNLDADSDLAHTEALIARESYGLVWFGEDERTPAITVEHPSQIIVATSAGDRRQRLAALKCWREEDGPTFANVYLPDGIYKFDSIGRASWTGGWGEREVPGEENPVPNPLGVVPVVPLTTRRRMLDAGQSELERVIPIQDRINRLTLDMMISAYFTAFRQRWATGLAIPKDPKTGEPVEPFKAAVDHLWTSTSKETRFGEFSETGLENYVRAIEMQVQHLAVQTRTPPHYFFLRGNIPSGESLRTAETGLVKKARQRMGSYGEGWEEIMRLALNIAGIRPRGAASMETQWADPESRTESEHVDGVLKRLALGVPLRQLWQDLGYSQEQVARFEQMLTDEVALKALLAEAGRTTSSDAGGDQGDPQPVPPATDGA